MPMSKRKTTFTTNGFKEEMGVFWHLLLNT